MNKNNVIIVQVCYNLDIINSILNDNSKENFHIIYSGNNNISDDLYLNKRITIARDLPNNIENENQLLTFTAWYLIVKNNLFSEFDYICLLEDDVEIDKSFEKELVKKCESNIYDIISFIYFSNYFMLDINEAVIKNFLETNNIVFNKFNNWAATTNHCLKRNKIKEFIDWYYPKCLTIEQLDSNNFSSYHERILYSFIDYNKYKVEKLIDLLNINYSGNKINILPKELANYYKNNFKCEFLKKFIENYYIFSKLNIDFRLNVGSYLCNGKSYEYTNDLYDKQKLLFESSKTCKNGLIIYNYMGHNAFIMLMANPDINITCIDIEENYKYILLLEEHFKVNINFIIANKQDNIPTILNNTRHKYDFIHISQQYPTREFLNQYIDLCIQQTLLDNLTFIIDDYNVYYNEIIEKIKNNNIHCKIDKESIVYGKDTSVKKFDIKKHNKYLLIYDDENSEYKQHIKNLVSSVKKYGMDFKIIIFYKKDINKDFVKNNKYILDQSRGGGYWLWKPYIINETLKKIKEGDILFYVDSKYYFTENFSELYKNVLEQDILVWKNKPNEEVYNLKNWCKMDIIRKYNIYEETFFHNILTCWAGALVIRKTPKSLSIINEWLIMCCSDDITDRKSLIENSPCFIDHRHDQSLLSIVLYKNNINLHYFEKKYMQNVRIPY